jgi:fatty acid-binding protein DegV
MCGEFSIAVAHTNAPDIGNRISQRIKQVFEREVVLAMNASPALGAHSGPGAFGVAIHNHSFSSSDNNRNT